MKDLADDLRAEVRRTAESLPSLSESEANASRGDLKWTRKDLRHMRHHLGQILGG
jgi:hypothetical protein